MHILKSKSLIQLRLKRNIVRSCIKLVENQSLSIKQITSILTSILTKRFNILRTDELLILSDILPYKNNIIDIFSNYKIIYHLDKNMNFFSEIQNCTEQNLKSISNLFADLNKYFGANNALKIIDNLSYWSLKCQQN